MTPGGWNPFNWIRSSSAVWGVCLGEPYTILSVGRACLHIGWEPIFGLRLAVLRPLAMMLLVYRLAFTRSEKQACVKPIGLMQNCLRTGQIEGQSVLDPFMGSRNHWGYLRPAPARHFIGIEAQLLRRRTAAHGRGAQLQPSLLPNHRVPPDGCARCGIVGRAEDSRAQPGVNPDR